MECPLPRLVSVLNRISNVEKQIIRLETVVTYTKKNTSRTITTATITTAATTIPAISASLGPTVEGLNSPVATKYNTGS